MDSFIRRVMNMTVVSADMPQLKECRICGRNTRTEWKSKHGTLWACQDENPTTVWNKILSKHK
jgi:hypothetical protein